MISSIYQIDTTTVSSFNTINIQGIFHSFNTNELQYLSTINLLTVSSLVTYDLSGISTNYTVDISGVEYLSTNQIEINFNDIVDSHNTLVEIESQNKLALNGLDYSALKQSLYKWAALGYPDSHLAYSFPVITPLTTAYTYPCSDGNSRTIWDYIPFFLGTSINDWLANYQTKMNGITLSFSVNSNPYVLNLHVSRG